jgi:type I restriction enzyme M protein
VASWWPWANTCAHHPEIFRDTRLREHFHHGMFHGFDFDNTMLRIGSMNLLLHGVENSDIVYRDSLAQGHAGEDEKYTLVLANPPLAGSLDYENCARDLQQVVKTKKTELLFLALFLHLLKPGDRAAVIVPDGVLFGSSTAHKTLRKLLVEGQKLDAVISLPSGAFKPYAGVSTAILLFTKTNSGGTDHRRLIPSIFAASHSIILSVFRPTCTRAFSFIRMSCTGSEFESVVPSCLALTCRSSRSL